MDGIGSRSMTLAPRSEGVQSGGFLPVCSYSNYLRSRVGASHVVDSLASNFSRSAIVIADELQRINIQLRGSSLEDAQRNSSIAGVNSHRMYESLLRGKGIGSIEILILSSLMGSSGFKAVEEKVLPSLYTVEQFRRVSDKFVERSARRFGWHNDVRNRELERSYLNLELATSIFMTEIAGYSTEVWEELPAALAPDPIAVAYGSAADELRAALGKRSLDRRLVPLASIAGGERRYY
jgi:hypothetical protein